MVETEVEPKHPYVTHKNAKIHLGFSITITTMAFIQIILGIVISEQAVDGIVDKLTNKDSYFYDNSYNYENLFYGDHIWIGFVGLVLGSLGFSVWHTRARANGIMLSIMLFISGFVIFPVAAALGGTLYANITYDGRELRSASAIYTAIQALFLIIWAFYTALHTCCNSKVRKQTRLNIQGGNLGLVGGQPQQNVVYVQQPVPYTAPGQGNVQYMTGGQPVQYMTGGQPVQYMTGGQPVQYLTGGQTVQYVTGQPVQYGAPPTQHGGATTYAVAPPHYNMAPPTSIQQSQVPVQVQHGAIPGTTDYPPSYSES